MTSYKFRLQYQNFFATVVAYNLMVTIPWTIHIISVRAASPITIEPPTTSVLNLSSRNTVGESNSYMFCESNSYMDDQRRCIKKGFSETCNKNEECGILKDMQLICSDGRCDCNTTISRHGTASKHFLYDDGSSASYTIENMRSTQCLGLVGLPCQNELCVQNAFCRSTTYSTGTCICLPDHTESKTRSCPSQYGGMCSHKADCIDGLFCWEGICSCRLEDQNYNPSTKACHSRVNGPCNDDSFGGGSCIENAECTEFTRRKIGVNQTNFGICECRPGFVESADGVCQVQFGEPCLMFGAKCDAAANLKCIDNTCQCKTFSQYNEEQRACLISVGGKCKLADSMQFSCVEHATCVGKPNNTVGYGLYGNCKCDTGYEVTRSYTCAPSSGGNVADTSDSNTNSAVNKHGDLELITRNGYGGLPPKVSGVSLNLPIRQVVIAHTATPNCTDHLACESRVRQIQHLHMNDFGWSDIGPNFVVGGDGRAYEGCGYTIGAHTLGYNRVSLCISFIGDFTTYEAPERQLRAAQLLIEYGVKLNKIDPNYVLYGQRQLRNFDSPGLMLYNKIILWPHWSKEIIPLYN